MDNPTLTTLDKYRDELHRLAEHHNLDIEVGQYGHHGQWEVAVLIKDKLTTFRLEEQGLLWKDGKPLGDNTVAGHSPASAIRWFHFFNHAAGEVFRSYHFRRFGQLSPWANENDATTGYTFEVRLLYSRVGRADYGINTRLEAHLKAPENSEHDSYASTHSNLDWFRPLPPHVKASEFAKLEAQIKHTLLRLPVVRIVNAAVAIEQRSKAWAMVGH